MSVDCTVIINPKVCLNSRPLSRCKSSKTRKATKQMSSVSLGRCARGMGYVINGTYFNICGEQSKQGRFQRTKDRHILSKTKSQITHLPFVNLKKNPTTLFVLFIRKGGGGRGGERERERAAGKNNRIGNVQYQNWMERDNMRCFLRLGSNVQPSLKLLEADGLPQLHPSTFH